MNPVFMVAYNNLELTKNAVASVLAQDIPVDLYFVDNGSTDGTWEWIREQPAAWALRKSANESPVKIANEMSAMIFRNHSYLMGLPNDVRIPPNCYRELLKWPRGFVCGTDIGQNEPSVHEGSAVCENTPMGVMLTRKWAYEAIVAKDGYFFDEGYFHYASDCDLALRMAACGIRGCQLNIPYWHYGSATHKLPEIHAQSCIQADKDRAYFVKKWGFKVDSLEYGQVGADPNWRGR